MPPQLASLADETPEGRSVVVLAKEKYGLRERDMASLGATFVPFTAQTRMSGIDGDGLVIRKGAVDSILKYVEANPRDAGGGTLALARTSTAARDEIRPHQRHHLEGGRHAARGGPRRASCSASSTSRTSSKAASASVSANCAGWASAR